MSNNTDPGINYDGGTTINPLYISTELDGLALFPDSLSGSYIGSPEIRSDIPAPLLVGGFVIDLYLTAEARYQLRYSGTVTIGEPDDIESQILADQKNRDL